jgi:hypothetical protein
MSDASGIFGGDTGDDARVFQLSGGYYGITLAAQDWADGKLSLLKQARGGRFVPTGQVFREDGASVVMLAPGLYTWLVEGAQEVAVDVSKVPIGGGADPSR